MKSPSTIVLHCNDPKIDREGDTGRTKERQDRWRAMEMGAKRDREMSRKRRKEATRCSGHNSSIQINSIRKYCTKLSKIYEDIEIIVPNHRN